LAFSSAILLESPRERKRRRGVVAMKPSSAIQAVVVRREAGPRVEIGAGVAVGQEVDPSREAEANHEAVAGDHRRVLCELSKSNHMLLLPEHPSAPKVLNEVVYLMLQSLLLKTTIMTIDNNLCKTKLYSCF
jgi:hypothetical protein